MLRQSRASTSALHVLYGLSVLSLVGLKIPIYIYLYLIVAING